MMTKNKERVIKALNGVGPGVGPSVRQVVFARLMKIYKESKKSEQRNKR
jgi:hypothetical protein